MRARPRILTLLCMLILAAALLRVAPPARAVGDNWLTGWDYRKSHVINAAAGAGSNYQVYVDVHYGSGTDGQPNACDVYMNGHGQDSSFGDVRFTDDTGDTLLDYWLISHVDDSYGNFTVEISDNLASSSATIYVYYGKAATSTTSSAVNTLFYFHDFEGDTVGQPPSKFVGTTNLQVYADTVEGAKALKNTAVLYPNIDYCDSSTIAGLEVKMKVRNVSPFQFSVNVRFTDWSNFVRVGAAYGNPANFFSVDELKSGSQLQINYTAFSWGAGWHDLTIRIYNTKVNATVDTTERSLTGLQLTQAGYIELMTWNGVANCGWDYIRVRKYCDPEPTHGAWGSEQTSMLYIQLYFTWGGNVTLDTAQKENGSLNGVIYQTTVEAAALVFENHTATWGNWTYGATVNFSNPCRIYMDENITLWCYFGNASAGTGDGDGVSLDEARAQDLAFAVVAACLISVLGLIVFFGVRRRR